MNCWEPLHSPDGHNVAGNSKRDGLKTVEDWAISSQAPVETQVKVQRLRSNPTGIASMDETDRRKPERAAPHAGEDIVHADVKASEQHERVGGSRSRPRSLHSICGTIGLNNRPVPHIGNGVSASDELLEPPESHVDHNEASNRNRDGLKTTGIGQSAAERPADKLVEGSTTRAVARRAQARSKHRSACLAGTRDSLVLRESVRVAADAVAAQHKRSSLTLSSLRGLTTRSDHVKPGEFGGYPWRLDTRRGQYRAKPPKQFGGRCNDLGWTTCRSSAMALTMKQTKKQVELPPTTSNGRTERPAVSIEMCGIIERLTDLTDGRLSKLYAEAYEVMRSKHATRSPAISLMYELGADVPETTREDRRHLRRYLMSRGVQLRGPDKQGHDRHTTALKSAAQKLIRRTEPADDRAARTEKMRKHRWVEKDPETLRCISDKQTASIKRYCDEHPDEVARWAKVGPEEARREYARRTEAEKLELQRQRMRPHVVQVVADNGDVIDVQSPWELPAYNMLLRLGVPFRFQASVIDLGERSWHPDFTLDIGYLEVKALVDFVTMQIWRDVKRLIQQSTVKNVFVLQKNVENRHYENLLDLLSECEVLNGTDEIVCTLRQRRDRGLTTMAPAKGQA